MDLQQVIQVIALVEHGSFSAAARACHISQPALTKSIKRLEAELGSPLFHRLPRGVTLTVFGEAAARRFRTMKAEAVNIVAELDALRGGTRGRLVIGVGNTWITQHMPSAVTRLLVRYPGLEIHVISGSIEQLTAQLHLGELDAVLGIVTEEHRTGDLRAEALIRSRSVVLARARHPLFQAKKPGFRDLAAARWALPLEGSPARQHFEAMFSRQGLAPPRPTLVSNSVAFLREVTRSTDLLGFGPVEALAAEASTGLKHLRISEAEWPFESGLILRRRPAPPPSVRLLAAELQLVAQKRARSEPH
jgi:LysR family transcriptional regulator of gallate degradation